MRKQDIYNHIVVNAETGCWNWTRGKDTRGYGAAYIPHRVMAHRLSYELSVGPIPPGKHVCHTCDNPSCINPDHLWIGTHAENMADKEAKGRGTKPPVLRGDDHWSRKHPDRVKRGADNPNAKLTIHQVIGIRRAYLAGMSHRDIATTFGISEKSVPDYISGKGWTTFSAGPSLQELRDAKRTTPAAKINRETAETIRARLAAGELGKDLAVEYGVHKATISNIKLRRIWK